MPDNRFCLPLRWKSRHQRIRKKDITKIDMEQIWNMKVKVIPLVISALGPTPIKLRNCLKEIGIEAQIIELQKTVLLHTVRILQKVHEV